MNKKRKSELERQVKELVDKKGVVTFYLNPKVDTLFGLYGGNQVPTKQDAFKPIDAVQISEGGVELPIKGLYSKSEDSPSIKEFTKNIREVASGIFNEMNRIKKPDLVEVIISVSTLERRFREVDVDNLAKCVLDGLNGIAFDDDSQVCSLLSKKFVHEMKLNSVLIAVTRVTNERKGLLGDIKLYGTSKWESEI